MKQEFKKKSLQKAFTGALAVEMEAHGGVSFAKRRNIQLKIIKGICDWSNKTKEKEWQPYCGDLASEFTVDYLIAKYGKIMERN